MITRHSLLLATLLLTLLGCAEEPVPSVDEGALVRSLIDSAFTSLDSVAREEDSNPIHLPSRPDSADVFYANDGQLILRSDSIQISVSGDRANVLVTVDGTNEVGDDSTGAVMVRLNRTESRWYTEAVYRLSRTELAP